MLRVLIADDHGIVRQGLRLVIQAHPDWEVCAETGHGGEVMEMARRTRPDVAILDVSLPGVPGIDLTRQLRQMLPQTEVLLFTMHADEGTVSAGLIAGAKAYLLKTDEEKHLLAAVAALAEHRPYVSPAVSDILLQASPAGRDVRRDIFTARELALLQLIANGDGGGAIALRLGISPKTVESHRASAMRKAGVRNSAELVRFALRHRLIQA